MAMSIVSMLLENGFDDFQCDASSITESEARSYTLESGAALMARKCAQELHEIFEVAVIETNEAALAAYMEGCSDVMESATYGAVFEASDKNAGNKILEFLKTLKDRVFAFFKNIGAKVTALVTNYDNFLKKNKEKMVKAEKERTEQLKVSVRSWDENAIKSITSNLKQSSTEIGTLAAEIAKIVTDSFNSKTADTSKEDAKKILDDCEKAINNAIDNVYNKLLPGVSGTDIDMSTLNKDCEKIFVGENKKTIVADVAYVSSVLDGTKKALSDVKTSQKDFNDAYNKAIKVIKGVTDNSKFKEKVGYSSYIHKATAAMSKIQSIANAYASAGYRAMISRANEAKALCGVIISGKVGKRGAEEGGNDNK